MSQLKIEMTLPGGRTFVAEGYAGFIRGGIEQLEAYRSTTRYPEELEWEIRLYRFILAQPDPDHAAITYLSARQRGRGQPPKSKRQVAAELGWSIP